MDLKKICKALVLPHVAVVAITVPIAAVMLIYAAVFAESDSPLAIAAYVLSAYALLCVCFRIPHVVRTIAKFRAESTLVKRWRADEHLRIKVSLYTALGFNILYAAFQLWLGLYHSTVWYYSFAGYYFTLAIMRYFLLRHTRSYRAGEQLRAELIKCRASGIALLGINLTLSVIVFFMIYWGRTFVHDEITTITMAAYTFTSFTFAIVNLVRYRRYGSPVYTAARSISLAAAAVSVLTLESTMLTTFGGETMDAQSVKLMLAVTGAAVAVFIIILSISLIASSSRQMKEIKKKDISNG